MNEIYIVQTSSEHHWCEHCNRDKPKDEQMSNAQLILYIAGRRILLCEKCRKELMKKMIHNF